MTAITGPNQQKNKIPSGYKQGQISNFTPEQIELLKQSIARLGPDSFLARLAEGDESMFEEIEAPQKRQFADIQAGIGSRYSGMGMGAQKSSGFQNEQTSAASNFAQELGAKRFGLRNQAMKDLMEMSNMMLNQRPNENFLVKKDQKQGWGGVVGAGIGAAGGFLAGGPPGAVTGANAGYQVGSQF